MREFCGNGKACKMSKSFRMLVDLVRFEEKERSENREVVDSKRSQKR